MELASELLPSSLPVFFHNSSDEIVDNESFDAPNRLYVGYASIVDSATIIRTKAKHVFIK